MIGYHKADLSIWQGRLDSTSDYRSFRWHQIIQEIDLSQDKLPDAPTPLSFIIIGYAVDKGVVLNNGRPGAKKGPEEIRIFLSNKPCSFSKSVQLYDGGNIIYENSVEDAQATLAAIVKKCLEANYFPLILGGGHDVALGNMMGILDYLNYQTKDFGIINFDAHFDVRPYKQSTSGTMFRQVYDKISSHNQPFKHITIGIQKSGNTVSLFDYIHEINSQYILAGNVNQECHMVNEYILENFTCDLKDIYLTVCSDVFASPFAPGVSSPQPLGILPEDFLIMLKQLLSTKKIRTFDIAEIAPNLDNSNSTASLGALIIYTIVNHLAEINNESI